MSEPHSICAFNDCAIPRDCECVKRGHPFLNQELTACLVPKINTMARELGWNVPYPDVETYDGPERGDDVG